MCRFFYYYHLLLFSFVFLLITHQFVGSSHWFQFIAVLKYCPVIFHAYARKQVTLNDDEDNDEDKNNIETSSI